eukprot:5203422-Prorocentrum_lima.AAC.1
MRKISSAEGVCPFCKKVFHTRLRCARHLQFDSKLCRRRLEQEGLEDNDEELEQKLRKIDHER